MDIVLALIAIALAATFGFVFVSACMNALFREGPARPGRDAIAAFAREWLATVLLVPAGLHGLLLARPPHPSPPAFPAEERTPVVLVPGFALNGGSMALLATYLRRCGWRWVHPINNRPRNTTVPILARNLAHHVETLCAASGSDHVDIIGHSMGGIIASYYINELGGAARVRRLATLGTPWRGTRAWVFGWTREARDLRPGSPVLEAAQPGAVPTTSVWSESDGLVLPPTSSVVPGVRVTHLPHVGHLEMLMNGRAWRAAAAGLAIPEGALPPPVASRSRPTEDAQTGGAPAPDADEDRLQERV